jgi:Zn-dependent metalloprotease
MRKIIWAVFAALATTTALTLVAVPASQVATARPSSSFEALSGRAAANYALPADMRLVRRLQIGGWTYERYQQVFGEHQAAVLGGQVSIYRDAGVAQTVIGSHYASITPTNSVRISKSSAFDQAARRVGASGRQQAGLMIDPETGRYFWRVETRRFAGGWELWIDAGNGKAIAKINVIEDNHGIGVKGDTKDLDGGPGLADDLTVLSGGIWHLRSSDGRQSTSDAQNAGTTSKDPATDADNHWTLPGSTSPGHPALVDAQYYGNVADDYFQRRQGFDFIDCYPGGMELVAHYGKGYDNAFWNGKVTVYGDGSGVIFRELSGGLDVVAHENTHAVTQCTSNLVYRDESGALNESFSDMLGNSAEFFAQEPRSSNCVRATGQSICADWTIGEDVYLPSDAVPGFRNMADPEEDNDPDDYSELLVGSADRGFVHSNSAISNHAYYLLVNGGMNASCAAPATHQAEHCGPGEPVVAGIGLIAAEQVMFAGITSLPERATFCDARKATEASAAAIFGAGSQQAESTTDAWDAVGVPTNC